MEEQHQESISKINEIMHNNKRSTLNIDDSPDFNTVYLKADPNHSPGLKHEHVFVTDNDHF